MSASSSPPREGLFERSHSAEIVNARMGADTNPRLREVLSIMVKHMHAAIIEANLQENEWFEGIKFLTETGRMCSDWRQEFILLSDVLGVSMLVDALTHDPAANETESTVLGPFYVDNPPHYENGANICLDGRGEPLLVRGRVTDTDGNPIAGATVDSWQTNEEGFYDVQQRGIQPEWNLRGVFTTDENGEYWFRSVKPRFYPIPDDGPVGKLLAKLGRHPYRPAHIHFIVRAQGFLPVTTHIFHPECEYLNSDPVFGVKEALIADFRESDDASEAARHGLTAPFSSVDWDFVLARA